MDCIVCGKKRIDTSHQCSKRAIEAREKQDREEEEISEGDREETPSYDDRLRLGFQLRGSD